MKTFAFIFARGGSKGIRNKNLIKINNLTILEHSILVAKKSKKIDKIVVSSDSDKILKIAEKYNVLTIKRPKKLSLDKSREWDAWIHTVKQISRSNNFDLFVSLPTTSPLRKIVDINSALNAFIKFKPDILYTINESSKNPYFNMVVKSKNKIKKIITNKTFHRRQDAPIIYDLNTVAVVTKPNYILSSPHQFYGNVYGHIIPKIRSLDIDTYLDYKIAKLLMEKNVK